MNYMKLRIQEAFENLRSTIRRIDIYQSPIENVFQTGEAEDIFGAFTTYNFRFIRVKDGVSGVNHTIPCGLMYGMDNTPFSSIDLSAIGKLRIADNSCMSYSNARRIAFPREVVASRLIHCPTNGYCNDMVIRLPYKLSNDDGSYLTDFLCYPNKKQGLKKITCHPNGLWMSNLYLQYFEVDDECMRGLAESIPNNSGSSYTRKVVIGATNLANISEETINLFETKGWTLS